MDWIEQDLLTAHRARFYTLSVHVMAALPPIFPLFCVINFIIRRSHCQVCVFSNWSTEIVGSISASGMDLCPRFLELCFPV